MPADEARPPRGERVAGVCIAVAGAWAGWHSFEYPLGTLAEPGPGLLPLVLAVALAAIGLVIALVGAGASTAAASADFADAPHAILLLAVLGAAAAVLERLGYRLTVALALVVLLGIVERRSAATVLLIAAGFSAGSFFLLNDLLRVPLPVGRWGW